MHKLFPSQLTNEKIYLVVREHWILLVLRLSVVVLFAIIGPIAYQFLFTSLSGSIATFMYLVAQVYYLLLLVAAFLIFIFYYLTMNVVTNTRIVDINQKGLFSHTVAELHLENTQDVTSEQKGVLATMFGFGTVFIQTAGEKTRFEFTNVPHPEGVAKLILDLYAQVPKKSTP